MANHASAKKRIKQSEKKKLLNNNKKSQIKTSIRNLNEQIDKKDKNSAKKQVVKVESVIMKSVSKGVLKKETASRIISRLIKKIKKLG
ncbi:MAG: 30S ribosomal protein S20 [Rickettsiales bacterium]|nr:30S ribosomal protein S20 [Rickettsiales bacterium]